MSPTASLVSHAPTTNVPDLVCTPGGRRSDAILFFDVISLAFREWEMLVLFERIYVYIVILRTVGCTKTVYYKKHSYRRDTAHRRSLRRSRSFKVIHFSTSRKLLCDSCS